MKKWMTKICSLFMALMMFFTAYPICAQADFDPAAEATLCLTMEKDGVMISGGSLECIPVATVVIEDANAKYIYVPQFAAVKIPLVNFENKAVVDEINRIAVDQKLEGPTAMIENGKADFGEKPHGVYLIRQKDPTPGYEAISPFLITVPQYDEVNDIYIYEINASPKTEIMTAPATSDTTEPSESSGSSSESSSSTSSSQLSSASSSTSSSSSKKSSSSSSSASKTQPGGKNKTSKVKTGVFENLIGYELLAIAAFGAILLLRKFSAKERNK